jgi:hypothetical protein
MFRGSKKGLKEHPMFLGVLRVMSKVIMNRANEAQNRNQEQLKRTLEPIIINDGMDTKMKPGST